MSNPQQFDLDALLDATDIGDASFNQIVAPPPSQVAQQKVQPSKNSNIGVKRASPGSMTAKIQHNNFAAYQQAAYAAQALQAQQNRAFVQPNFAPHMHYPRSPLGVQGAAMMYPQYGAPMMQPVMVPQQMRVPMHPQHVAPSYVVPQMHKMMTQVPTPVNPGIPNVKNMIDITVKSKDSSQFPKYYGNFEASIIITQNSDVFLNKAQAQEDTPMTLKLLLSQSQVHVFGEKNEYYGYLETGKKTDFFIPLLRQKIISAELDVRSDTSEATQVNVATGTATKLPTDVRVYFNKKAITIDPTLGNSSSDDASDDIIEPVDEATQTKKMYLKGLFDRIDNYFGDDDDDDDAFLDDLDEFVPSKRQKTEAKQDVASAKKVVDDEDLNDDDDDLNEYLKPQSKEQEEESKKVLQSAQLGKLYDSITVEVSENDTFSKDQYAEQPKNMRAQLRPYQLIALKWMLDREQHGKDNASAKKLDSMYVEKKFKDGTVFYFNAIAGILTLKFIQAPPDPKGGILADEMGLGKTLEMLSLIVTNKCPNGDTYAINPTIMNHKYVSKATLIICPLTLLDQWEKEIARHAYPPLKVTTLQGGKRIKEAKKLLCYDVIITTYQTLSNEYSQILQNKRPIEECPMFCTTFWRVVLDEAHVIKNRKSLMARACSSIEAQRRWAMSGTPIQNHIDDLFSLFKFIRVNPHGEWRWWTKYIGKPFEKKEKKAIDALQDIIKKLVIRRTKSKKINGEKIVSLPNKTVEVHDLELSPEELELYKALYEYSKYKFDEYMASGLVMKNYANILEMLLHLRQACCHPALFLNSFQRKTDKSTFKTCLENFVKNNSPHTINAVLPMLPDILKDKPVDVEASLRRQFRGSTKVNSLVEYLLEIRSHSKSVVFSQWTSMLDVIGIALEKNAMKYVRLDGSMQRKDRDAAVENFKNDPDVVCCLISLKVGGVGLNLVWANYVFLMDPWWNPAVEEQAIDRVYRIGQEKDVTVIRYIIKNSVEEKILRLQESKAAVASNALGDGDGIGSFAMSKKDAQKIRMDDLRRLFNEEDEWENEDEAGEDDAFDIEELE